MANIDAQSLVDDLSGQSAMRSDTWSELDGIETWRSWADLRARFVREIAKTFGDWISEDQAHFRQQLTFALGRFDEGAGIIRFFERYYSHRPGLEGQPIRLLDIGAGNGGVTFATANCRRYRAVALDIVPNNDLLRCKRNLGVPLEAVVGTGKQLPFAAGSFDVVLLLDTIEHVSQPDLLGHEVMRLLAPGGLCMLTTPPV